MVPSALAVPAALGKSVSLMALQNLGTRMKVPENASGSRELTLLFSGNVSPLYGVVTIVV